MRKTLVLTLLACMALPMAAQRPSVMIGNGDLVRVQVYDTPEMNQSVLVDDHGNAPLLFIGSVALTGMTPEQAAAAIQAALISKKYMRHPQVEVSIEKSSSLDVAVGGEVNHAGTFTITTPRSVLDLIDMAGGLTTFANHHIVIEHRQGGVQKVDYVVPNDPSKATEEAVLVYPGDRVTVPRAGIVYVLGDVGKPGGYVLNTNDAPITLLQALALAGAPNRTGVYSHTRLLRRAANGTGYSIVPVNLNDVKAGKAADPVVEANDVIYVPFSYMKNFAINSVSLASSLGSAAIYAER